MVKSQAEAKSEGTSAGEQHVIPGAEKVSDAEVAKRKAREPLKPKAEQKPADEGLFGDEANQTDLVDIAGKPTTAKPGYSNDAFLRDVLICLDKYNDGARVRLRPVVDVNGDRSSAHRRASDRLLPMGSINQLRAHVAAIAPDHTITLGNCLPGQAQSEFFGNPVDDRLYPHAAFGHLGDDAISRTALAGNHRGEIFDAPARFTSSFLAHNAVPSSFEFCSA
jgi:hypothetical protein